MVIPMDALTITTQGHSARVRMELRIHGQVVPIAQMGPDFVIVKEPVEFPPGQAEIFMSIDGSARSWHVYLVEGVTARRRETRIAPATTLE